MANFSNKKLCSHKGCNKVLEVISEKIAGGYKIQELACGHKIVTKRDFTLKSQAADEAADLYNFKFGEHEDLTLMPFQKDGVKFLERNKFRGLIADDPGLGKTFQFLAPLRMHPKEVLPALIICKAGLRSQIGKEVFRMTDIPAQVMYASYEKPMMFKRAIVVVSYDSIWRMKWDESIWSKFKTIIFDECQALKNPSSNRTQKIKEICKTYDYPNRIGASATPIKNRGSEYFQILHLLDAAKFPTESGFLLRWIEQDDKGKWRGVKEHKMEEWKQFTKDLIIRRKKEDVLPDLPPIRRSYRNCDLAEEVEEAYAEQMKGFMQEYADGEITQMKFMNLLAYIARMRHLVGMSKIPDTIEEVDEVLLGSDEKVVVFVHHIKVAQALMKKLMERCTDAGYDWEPVWLEGGMDNVRRDEVIEAFTQGKSRVMIASQLASGEGVDGLQKVCGYAIMHERQWNPANEEQCEGRFSRIGSVKSSVLVKYMVAVGTIDEWLTNLIDEKRIDVTATLDGRYVTPDETSLTREMMDIIYRNGRQRWKLQ
jgi:chromodomain-helicase-DNA-binding protein 4